MATATRPIPPQPDPNHPIVDPETGKIDRVWFEYLVALDRVVRALRTEIP